MESLLEIQRRSHEERERLLKLMVDEFIDKKLSEKDKIFSEHRVKVYMDVSRKKEFNKFQKIYCIYKIRLTFLAIFGDNSTLGRFV
jgi:predicted transposase YbfD/YdcC